MQDIKIQFTFLVTLVIFSYQKDSFINFLNFPVKILFVHRQFFDQQW